MDCKETTMVTVVRDEDGTWEERWVGAGQLPITKSLSSHGTSFGFCPEVMKIFKHKSHQINVLRWPLSLFCGEQVARTQETCRSIWKPCSWGWGGMAWGGGSWGGEEGMDLGGRLARTQQWVGHVHVWERLELGFTLRLLVWASGCPVEHVNWNDLGQSERRLWLKPKDMCGFMWVRREDSLWGHFSSSWESGLWFEIYVWVFRPNCRPPPTLYLAGLPRSDCPPTQPVYCSQGLGPLCLPSFSCLHSQPQGVHSYLLIWGLGREVFFSLLAEATSLGKEEYFSTLKEEYFSTLTSSPRSSLPRAHKTAWAFCSVRSPDPLPVVPCSMGKWSRSSQCFLWF